MGAHSSTIGNVRINVEPFRRLFDFIECKGREKSLLVLMRQNGVRQIINSPPANYLQIIFVFCVFVTLWFSL